MGELAQVVAIGVDAKAVAQHIEPENEKTIRIERIPTHHPLVAPKATDVRVHRYDVLVRPRVEVKEDIAAPADPVDRERHKADRTVALAD